MQDQSHPTRRALVKTAVLGGAVVAAQGIPMAAYVTAPARQPREGKWIEMGSVRDLEPNRITMLSYDYVDKDGWTVSSRRGVVWAKTGTDGRLTIFSATCPHLACSVNWQEDEQAFICPCHSGRFNEDGQPVAGPPVKPLTVLDHQVDAGTLRVLMPA